MDMGYCVVSEPTKHIDKGMQVVEESIMEFYTSRLCESTVTTQANVEYEHSLCSDLWQMDGQKVLDLGIEVL